MSKNKTQFAIYEYEIIEAKEKSAFSTQNLKPKSLEERRDIFSKILGKGCRLNLYTTKDDGTADIYENYKWNGCDDVFVYQVNNKQNKTLVKPTGETLNGIPQFDEETETSMPLGRIAIDNRKIDDREVNKGLIAIEKNAGWGKTPDKLRGLLEVSFRRILIDYGLDIKIQAKLQPTEFWSFLDEQCEKNGDSVTRVSIEFNHKNKKKQDNTETWRDNPKQRPARLMKSIDDIAKKNNAIKSIFTMEFESVNARKIKDMVHIAQLCDENEYELSVGLKNFGIYRSGDFVTVFFPMDEEALIFLGKQIVSDRDGNHNTFQLMTWFDEVWAKVKTIENEAATPRKGKRGNKR